MPIADSTTTTPVQLSMNSTHTHYLLVTLHNILWQLSLMKAAIGWQNVWLNFCRLQAGVPTHQIFLAPRTFRLLWPACISSVPSCAFDLQAQPWPPSPTWLWWHVHVTTLCDLWQYKWWHIVLTWQPRVTLWLQRCLQNHTLNACSFLLIEFYLYCKLREL